jgi:hypothetical protein
MLKRCFFVVYQPNIIMLGNLDNEVYFKKVFTDTTVFKAFVKDTVGIDIEIEKVETEKVLLRKVSSIRFKMDLFAESTDHRVVVEIQKVDYDYSYNRFSHYFLANLLDQQSSSRDYAFAKEVYVIVVVTAPYRISDATGKPIKDDILLATINPQTLQGEVREIYGHKLLIINTTYLSPQTPKAIADWMNLIRQSIKNPENPQINRDNPAILRAAQLAEIDELTPEQLAEAKEQESRKIATVLREQQNKDEAVAKILKLKTLSFEQIAEAFSISLQHVERIQREVNLGYFD